jgi:hypothetical protein
MARDAACFRRLDKLAHSVPSPQLIWHRANRFVKQDIELSCRAELLLQHLRLPQHRPACGTEGPSEERECSTQATEFHAKLMNRFRVITALRRFSSGGNMGNAAGRHRNEGFRGAHRRVAHDRLALGDFAGCDVASFGGI